ncbi:MAG: hypothetical protein C7B46_06710 [Sulfobacillus benefaciens]|uniref:Peptidase M48 domain-containing protein n=1 Tax=Sulfobacillus benefaciens TaxID=453960 RepID=A0A2T2XI04_9FIRM|nr:MAG: hypothetical protein C7B46_06710 [Sulfobacillus benefaciens]
MNPPNMRRQYRYLIVGIGWAFTIAGVLTFALVSSVRHLLWLGAMHRAHMAPIWLWGIIGLMTVGFIVFWYRIISSIAHHRQAQRRLAGYLWPRLEPFPYPVPDGLQHIAEWSLVNDDHLQQTFTWGLFSPHIVISKKLWDSLDGAAQTAVMYHEAAHAMSRDPLQQVVLQILAFALRPFGLGALYQRYLLHREIAADRLAVAACSGDDSALLTALLIAAKSHVNQVSEVGLLNALEVRIQFLETQRLPSENDMDLRLHLLSTTGAMLLVLGQGLVVWCH